MLEMLGQILYWTAGGCFVIAVLLRVSARIGMGWQAGRTPDRLEADLADLADHPKDKVTGECVGRAVAWLDGTAGATGVLTGVALAMPQVGPALVSADRPGRAGSSQSSTCLSAVSPRVVGQSGLTDDVREPFIDIALRPNPCTASPTKTMAAASRPLTASQPDAPRSTTPPR